MKPRDGVWSKATVGCDISDGPTQPHVLAGPRHVVVVGEVILQPGLVVNVLLPALNIHHQGDRRGVHHGDYVGCCMLV